MKIADYPPQEPFNANAAIYHDEVMRRGMNAGPSVESRYGDDSYQSIAIFPAPEPDGRLLVFVHGGGWTNGYKEWMSFMAPAFIAAGVTFVAIGYRLAPGQVFPAGYDDVADGLIHVLRRVGVHGGDPNKLYVGGHSAGDNRRNVQAHGGGSAGAGRYSGKRPCRGGHTGRTARVEEVAGSGRIQARRRADACARHQRRGRVERSAGVDLEAGRGGRDAQTLEIVRGSQRARRTGVAAARRHSCKQAHASNNGRTAHAPPQTEFHYPRHRFASKTSCSVSCFS